MNKQLLTNTPKSPMAKAARLFELQTLLKEIKPEIDALKLDLLNVMQSLDVQTLKTGTYTLSKAKRITPRIEDFETLKKSLTEQQIPFETVETFAPFMTDVFKRAVEEGRKLDGLDALETEYVSIRVAKKEEDK